MSISQGVFNIFNNVFLLCCRSEGWRKILFQTYFLKHDNKTNMLFEYETFKSFGRSTVFLVHTCDHYFLFQWLVLVSIK